MTAVLEYHASARKYFVKLPSEVLKCLKLDRAMYIENTTNGVSNFQNKGCSVIMHSQSPSHVHVWFHAHALNPGGSICGRNKSKTNTADVFIQLERHSVGPDTMLSKKCSNILVSRSMVSSLMQFYTGSHRTAGKRKANYTCQSVRL